MGTVIKSYHRGGTLGKHCTDCFLDRVHCVTGLPWNFLYTQAGLELEDQSSFPFSAFKILVLKAHHHTCPIYEISQWRLLIKGS